MQPAFKFSFALTTIVSALAGCSSSDTATVLTPTDVTIPFEAEANGQPINCDTPLTGLGTTSLRATVKDFRFYVHNVQLTTNLGNARTLTLAANDWQQSDTGIALIDFQDKADACAGDTKETHTSLTGQVPLASGESITGLTFSIGVPASENHQNQVAASTPLNLSSLFWSWQSGYKHMRLDVAPEGGITRPTDSGFSGTTWNLHLGSTDCTDDAQNGDEVSCGRNNRPDIILTDFDPTQNHVFFDYAALVAGANLSEDSAGPAGCMSGLTDTECSPVFAALGLNLTSGNTDTSLTQSVFSVR